MLNLLREARMSPLGSMMWDFWLDRPVLQHWRLAFAGICTGHLSSFSALLVLYSYGCEAFSWTWIHIESRICSRLHPSRIHSPTWILAIYSFLCLWRPYITHWSWKITKCYVLCSIALSTGIAMRIRPKVICGFTLIGLPSWLLVSMSRDISVTTLSLFPRWI